MAGAQGMAGASGTARDCKGPLSARPVVRGGPTPVRDRNGAQRPDPCAVAWYRTVSADISDPAERVSRTRLDQRTPSSAGKRVHVARGGFVDYTGRDLTPEDEQHRD
jgi:hypothetical protein